MNTKDKEATEVFLFLSDNKFSKKIDFYIEIKPRKFPIISELCLLLK